VSDLLKSKDEVVVVSFLKKKSDQETFAKVASALRESVAFANFEGQGPEGEEDAVVLYRPKQLQVKANKASLAHLQHFIADQVGALEGDVRPAVGQGQADYVDQGELPRPSGPQDDRQRPRLQGTPCHRLLRRGLRQEPQGKADEKGQPTSIFLLLSRAPTIGATGS